MPGHRSGAFDLLSAQPPRSAPRLHTERIQPRALSAADRARVRELLNSPEHVDEAPATVWAKLLDEGRFPVDHVPDPP